MEVRSDRRGVLIRLIPSPRASWGPGQPASSARHAQYPVSATCASANEIGLIPCRRDVLSGVACQVSDSLNESKIAFRGGSDSVPREPRPSGAASDGRSRIESTRKHPCRFDPCCLPPISWLFGLLLTSPVPIDALPIEESNWSRPLKGTHSTIRRYNIDAGEFTSPGFDDRRSNGLSISFTHAATEAVFAGARVDASMARRAVAQSLVCRFPTDPRESGRLFVQSRLESQDRAPQESRRRPDRAGAASQV